MNEKYAYKLTSYVKQAENHFIRQVCNFSADLGSRRTQVGSEVAESNSKDERKWKATHQSR